MMSRAAPGCRLPMPDLDLAQIPNLWKLDIVGIISEPYSPEEKLALDKFDKFGI